MCAVRQLTDAILPSLKLNVSLPTCLLLFQAKVSVAHTFFYSLLSDFPSSSSCLVLSLFIVSMPVFTLHLSLCFFFLPHFLLSTLVGPYKVFILFLLLSISISVFCVLSSSFFSIYLKEAVYSSNINAP